jgi:hypothetical protein
MLLEHDTAGDPISGLKWTRKTTENIAELLQQIDLPVSAKTVARLLYRMHISTLWTRFQRRGLPILSVDSKKRERIGQFSQFKNSGAKWDRSPVLVNERDVLSDASGVCISYGLYDPSHNRGTICVGISHDTPALAAHSIATWWKREGSRRYGPVPELLALADSGGSNRYSSWA